jgi:hypothetical protein
MGNLHPKKEKGWQTNQVTVEALKTRKLNRIPFDSSVGDKKTRIFPGKCKPCLGARLLIAF